MKQYIAWQKEEHLHKCQTTNMHYSFTNYSIHTQCQTTGFPWTSNNNSMAEMNTSKSSTSQITKLGETYYATDLNHLTTKSNTLGSMTLLIHSRSNVNNYYYNNSLTMN